MSEDESNVLDLKAGLPSARLKRLDFGDKRARCRHRAIAVWPREPIIECVNCGAVVDPYEWIRTVCRNWEMMKNNQEIERAETAAEIAELKKALKVLRREYAGEAERRQLESAVAILPPRRRV